MRMEKCKGINSFHINATILVLIMDIRSFPTVNMFQGLKNSSPSQLTDTHQSALSVLSDAAKDGKYADAQYCLGQCYHYGHGVNVDEKSAAELYAMAASQGHSAGQFNLGSMYLHGRGVPKDRAMAKSWLLKAENIRALEWFMKITGEVDGGGSFTDTSLLLSIIFFPVKLLFLILISYSLHVACRHSLPPFMFFGCKRC
jgi:hypothetical protein